MIIVHRMFLLAVSTDGFEMRFSTSLGNFLFYQDFWGIFYIYPFDKNADIEKIEMILRNDPRFVKEEVVIP